ncbi:MAG: hypothetical protein FWH14_07775 [Oscillospiraceae bacterium]|nr:hypothetical protein [Oscillospiraceae bacterium]
MTEILRTDLPGKRAESADNAAVAALFEAEKNNGNLEKARQLGAILAAEVDSNDGEFVFGLDNRENHDIILQRRLLLAFTITKALEMFAPNAITAKTASGFFLDTVKVTSPHIYADIRENPAFSYYLLALRESKSKSGNSAVGKTFSKLCGREEDEIYKELGEALYLHFLDLVCQKCEGLRFVL